MTTLCAPVLVTHPGRQHSHQAALGLQASGILAGYWAGVPCLRQHGRWVPAGLWRRLVRYGTVALEPSKVRWFPWTPVIRRLGDALLPRGLAFYTDFLACRLFDRWVAGRLARVHPTAVIACEISARDTFRLARRLGITTFLDAPSFHHEAQDRLHGYAEPASLHNRITRLKDEEIQLADQILTVSPLARQTYVDAGAPAGKVHSILLGADLDLFFPPEEKSDAADRNFTFLFCGARIYRKGFDLLAEAFRRVAESQANVRLRIVGPRGDAAHHLNGASHQVATVGQMSQPELAQEMRRADCLVLPSRNDSYGMVVAEALATGLPVVVSEMVGAKELVRPDQTGWVVPAEEVEALTERMLWCARHREELGAMGPECRRVAESATWPAYHRRFADLISALLASP